MTTEELVRRGGPEGAGIRPSYAELCRPVINGLACHGVDAFHAGICDISTISTDGSLRKLAGTAQLRRKDMVLVHGSLLVNADLAQLGQYLRFPSEQPDYRRDRSHADFCATVSSLVSGVAPEELMESLCGAVARAALADGWEVLTPPTELDAEARALFEQKYTSENWNWKKVRPPSSTGVAADRRER